MPREFWHALGHVPTDGLRIVRTVEDACPYVELFMQGGLSGTSAPTDGRLANPRTVGDAGPYKILFVQAACHKPFRDPFLVKSLCDFPFQVLDWLAAKYAAPSPKLRLRKKQSRFFASLENDRLFFAPLRMTRGGIITARTQISRPMPTQTKKELLKYMAVPVFLRRFAFCAASSFRQSPSPLSAFLPTYIGLP